MATLSELQLAFMNRIVQRQATCVHGPAFRVVVGLHQLCVQCVLAEGVSCAAAAVLVADGATDATVDAYLGSLHSHEVNYFPCDRCGAPKPVGTLICPHCHLYPNTPIIDVAQLTASHAVRSMPSLDCALHEFCPEQVKAAVAVGHPRMALMREKHDEAAHSYYFQCAKCHQTFSVHFAPER